MYVLNVVVVVGLASSTNGFVTGTQGLVDLKLTTRFVWGSPLLPTVPHIESLSPRLLIWYPLKRQENLWTVFAL